ncbi:MAG: DNA polymerase III subunit chi [Pseudomonadota bacterium]|nr:DNA polymerase III subunit chi [Pseudomonadota bacterium]
MFSKKIDFYIYELGDYQSYQTQVCQIVEAAYEKKEQILLLCENEERCKEFDSAMWTFKDTCFIPHTIVNKKEIVTLNDQKLMANHSKTLINISYTFPRSLSEFNYIIEMSGYDNASRQKARENFKKYKNMKFNISSVHIKT